MLQARIEDLRVLQRPLLLTEFMARPQNSTFANNLPVLHRENVWGYAWGPEERSPLLLKGVGTATAEIFWR